MKDMKDISDLGESLIEQHFVHSGSKSFCCNIPETTALAKVNWRLVEILKGNDLPRQSFDEIHNRKTNAATFIHLC